MLVPAVVVNIARVQAGKSQAHQLLGVADRKRAKEGLIEQREDGGVGSDAEREGENSDRGEAGRLLHLPADVLKIMQQVGHRHHVVRF